MNFDKKGVKTILFLILCAVVLFWGFQNINDVTDGINSFISIISPFILGGAIAFIINVPMKKIEELIFKKSKMSQKGKRVIAYLITLILLILILALVMFVIIPEIAATIEKLVVQIPPAFNAAREYIEDLFDSNAQISEVIEKLNINFESLTKELITLLQNSASSLLNISFVVVGGLIGGTFSFIIGFVFSVYLLFQKEKMAGQCKRVIYALLSETKADRTVYIFKMANVTFSKFISGQCLEALILGVLFYIIMKIFAFPYALLISVLVGITALVPIIGPFIGCAVGAFLILIVNPLRALVFILVFLIVQQLEGNLIYPRVVGNSIGLPPVWVLVAVTVGGGLFGVGGMLIFIPLCSVIYALFKEMVANKLSEKKIAEEKLQ